MTDLDTLLAAKRHSDQRRYSTKHRILRQMIHARPDDFIVDSNDGKGIVGVTHRPTGFKFHMPTRKVPPTLPPVVKSASKLGILEGLVRQAPLFGKRIQEQARRGVTIHNVGLSEGKATDAFDKVTGLLRHPSVTSKAHADGWAPIKKGPGVQADFVGRFGDKRMPDVNALGRPGNTSKLRAVGNSKIKEYEAFPELIPRSSNLKTMLDRAGVSHTDDAAVMAHMKQQFPKGFVLKPDGGSATSSGSLVTDRSSVGDLTRLRQRGVRNAYGLKFKGDAGSLLAQERLEIPGVSRFERGANNAAEMYSQGRLGDLLDVGKGGKAMGAIKSLLGEKLHFKSVGSMTGSNSREYRVHVLDGKVVPYATFGRGSILGALPIRTPGAAAAEEATRTQLARIDPSRMKGAWGFDVAATNNGHRVIETNPSVDGGSGLMAFPVVQDAVAAAIQGRIPRYIHAQRAATAGAGLGAAGLIAGIGRSQAPASSEAGAS